MTETLQLCGFATAGELTEEQTGELCHYATHPAADARQYLEPPSRVAKFLAMRSLEERGLAVAGGRTGMI